MIRMRRSSLWTLILSLASVGWCSLAPAEVRLAGVFGDHMVLQRQMPIPIWGWADANESVTVSFHEQTKTAIADAAGRWMVRLDQMQAGGPFTLRVSGGNQLQVVDARHGLLRGVPAFRASPTRGSVAGLPG